MSGLWVGWVPSASLLLLRLAGCHSAGASSGWALQRGTTGHLGEASQGQHMGTGTKEGEQRLRWGAWNVPKCSSMDADMPFLCTVGDGEAEWDVRRACLPKCMLLASGLWSTLLSLEKALKYSCLFIIKLLFKMMIEHGYNFKQGTTLMYFQSSAHKPNSCHRACWAMAWASKSILLFIGSSTAEGLLL